MAKYQIKVKKNKIKYDNIKYKVNNLLESFYKI